MYKIPRFVVLWHDNPRLNKYGKTLARQVNLTIAGKEFRKKRICWPPWVKFYKCIEGLLVLFRNYTFWISFQSHVYCLDNTSRWCYTPVQGPLVNACSSWACPYHYSTSTTDTLFIMTKCWLTIIILRKQETKNKLYFPYIFVCSLEKVMKAWLLPVLTFSYCCVRSSQTTRVPRAASLQVHSRAL